MKHNFKKVLPLKEQQQNEIIDLVEHLSDDELAFLTFYVLSIVDKKVIFSIFQYTENVDLNNEATD